MTNKILKTSVPSVFKTTIAGSGSLIVAATFSTPFSLKIRIVLNDVVDLG